MVSGTGAILDATFTRGENRESVVRLAKRLKVPLVAIHCFASDETTMERLARRAEEGKDLSDGRWEIYQRQKETHEPMEEIAPENLLELNTENSSDDLASSVEKFLRSRIAAARSAGQAPV